MAVSRPPMRHAIAFDYPDSNDPMYLAACYEAPWFLVYMTPQAEDACSYIDEYTAQLLVEELRTRDYPARTIEALG